MSGPPGVTLSQTEKQGFQALGQFLQAICAPFPITVVRALGSTAPGSNVRVPQPAVGDFVVMSSLREERSETNETTFSDNVCSGSIDATTLVVTNVSRGRLAPGQLLTDIGYPNGVIQPNTTITQQLTQVSGTPPGGPGTYQVSVSQILPTSVLYAGARADLASAIWTVQLDVHGPNSLNNVATIDRLFRSEYGVDFFANTGFSIAPLHVDTAGQMPFENAEEEIEFRWVMEARLAIGPIVSTPQMFAQEVHVTTIVTDVVR